MGKYYLITVVTSKKTQSMIEEAAEDDIDLFKKDKPAEGTEGRAKPSRTRLTPGQLIAAAP